MTMTKLPSSSGARTALALVGVLLLASCANPARQAPAATPSAIKSELTNVIRDQHDQLDPLPPSGVPVLTVDQVRTLLANSKSVAAPYMQDTTGMTVKLGEYTNPGLRQSSGNATDHVPSYIFSGLQGPCGAHMGPYGAPPPAPDSNQVCSAVIVANAATGELESLDISGSR